MRDKDADVRTQQNDQQQTSTNRPADHHDKAGKAEVGLRDTSKLSLKENQVSSHRSYSNKPLWTQLAEDIHMKIKHKHIYI